MLHERQMKFRQRTSEIVIWALLIVIALLEVFPIYWAVMSSFKPESEILAQSYTPYPVHPTLMQYVKIFQQQPFGRFIFNTFVVSAGATLLALITSATSGYIFAKFHFPLRNFLFLIVLGTIMIPIQVYAIPLFLFVQKLGLINTLPGIMIPGIIMSTGIFFMKQNMEMIPNELIDAARIDGCSEYRIFLTVIVPLSRAPIIAISIISFTVMWNDLFWPLMIAQTRENYTANLGLMLFQRVYITDYGAQMAGAVVVLLVPLLLFLFLRRYILEGFALSGLKG